jgi:hypothetical protein
MLRSNPRPAVELNCAIRTLRIVWGPPKSAVS